MRVLLMLLLMFMLSNLLAQTVTIKGITYSGMDNEVLFGAIVKLKGTINVAITDIDGNFVLKIPSGVSNIVFSYIGHKDAEVQFTAADGDTIELSATLAESSRSMKKGKSESSVLITRKTKAVANPRQIDFSNAGKQEILQAVVEYSGIDCGENITRVGQRYKWKHIAAINDDPNLSFWEYDWGNVCYNSNSKLVKSIMFNNKFSSFSLDATLITPLWGINYSVLKQKLGEPDGIHGNIAFSYGFKGLLITFNMNTAGECKSIRASGFDRPDIEYCYSNSIEKTMQNAAQLNNEPTTSLPPILSIQDITFSKNALNAGEEATLSIAVKNVGAGDAASAYINLSSEQSGLKFAAKTNIPVVAKSGGTQTVNIKVTAGLDIPTAEAVLKIEVVEPQFKVKIQGKQVKVPTRQFLKPEMLVAKFAAMENLSANPNNQIDINEQVDVKFALQNIGQGVAESVNVSVANNQPGVMLLGVLDKNGNLTRTNPAYATITPGSFETITYRYFINSEFTASQLLFSINATEKHGKYPVNQTKAVDVNKALQEEGYIRTVAAGNNTPATHVVIEDVPDFVSDVDENIPVNNNINDKTFAIVIGNENYSKEIKVSYALNDARMVKQYLQKTLGLPANNINYTENATYGQMLDALKWASDIAKAFNGQAKFIFYYAGHGMPDEQTKSAYIIPVDGNSKNTGTSVRLADVYSKLTEHSPQSVYVLLDACFSGATRETGEVMLAEGRGVKIKPRNEILNGNMVVFSATTGEETALPYKAKQHGMFTYYLLKKIKETKGNLTFEELSTFVTTNVAQQSVVINRKSQTPQVSYSTSISGAWGAWKVK